MHLCYIDESGVPELNQGTSHFVLVGMSIIATEWKSQDLAVEAAKVRYGLSKAEIHTGGITRRFIEQEKIKNFEKLAWATRRSLVEKEREAQLIRLAGLKGANAARERRNVYRKTHAYIHLTFGERLKFLSELADLIGSWNNVSLFGDALDRRIFRKAPHIPPREEAFSQVISRFHWFLNSRGGIDDIGLLVHDNEETSAARLTDLMRTFHDRGTMWAKITRIIETPFFVDSRLNGGVQLADLCAYATRRFFENQESDLFDRIYGRFRRHPKGRLVGLRHYVGGANCSCKVCVDHRG